MIVIQKDRNIMIDVFIENIRTLFGSAVTVILGVISNTAVDQIVSMLSGIVAIIVGVLTAMKLIHQFFLYRKKTKNGEGYK